MKQVFWNFSCTIGLSFSILYSWLELWIDLNFVLLIIVFRPSWGGFCLDNSISEMRQFISSNYWSCGTTCRWSFIHSNPSASKNTSPFSAVILIITRNFVKKIFFFLSFFFFLSLKKAKYTLNSIVLQKLL